MVVVRWRRVVSGEGCGEVRRVVGEVEGVVGVEADLDVRDLILVEAELAQLGGQSGDELVGGALVLEAGEHEGEIRRR